MLTKYHKYRLICSLFNEHDDERAHEYTNVQIGECVKPTSDVLNKRIGTAIV